MHLLTLGFCFFTLTLDILYSLLLVLHVQICQLYQQCSPLVPNVGQIIFHGKLVTFFGSSSIYLTALVFTTIKSKLYYFNSILNHHHQHHHGHLWYLACARHWFKPWLVLTLILTTDYKVDIVFYGCGNWGTEKLSDLSKATQLLNSRGNFGIQAVWSYS